jgi:hypothetical protein
MLRQISSFSGIPSLRNNVFWLRFTLYWYYCGFQCSFEDTFHNQLQNPKHLQFHLDTISQPSHSNSFLGTEIRLTQATPPYYQGLYEFYLSHRCLRILYLIESFFFIKVYCCLCQIQFISQLLS